MMASNPDLVQYIADQCSGAGEIAVKKMPKTISISVMWTTGTTLQV